MCEAGTAGALVIVPFENIVDAHEWANRLAEEYPHEPRVLVTPGAEVVRMDPGTGAVEVEVTFCNDWRATYAGSGEVRMVRRCAPAMGRARL